MVSCMHEPLSSQKPQRQLSNLSYCMSYKIPSYCNLKTYWSNNQINLSWDCKAIWYPFFGNWRWQGLCAFSRPISANDVAKEYSPDNKKHHSANGFKKTHPEVRKDLWGGAFWTSGCFINTISRNGSESAIADYVKNQGTEKGYLRLHRDTPTLFDNTL